MLPVEKTRDRKSGRNARQQGSRTETRSLSTVELHLESTDASEDPLEPLDRGDVRRVVHDDLGDRLVPEGSDEWTDSSTDARLVVGQDRLLLRLALPDESREHLAHRLDKVYDLAFELASALGLEIVDPQVGSVVTRFRYEQQFQRFLDVYFTRARTAAALSSSAGWTEFADMPFTLESLPAIETEPEALPPTVWSAGKRGLGVLEFTGERALAALTKLGPSPFLAIIPLHAESGDDAAILRVRRLIHPLPGLALVDVETEGVSRIRSLDRVASVLTLAPREK